MELCPKPDDFRCGRLNLELNDIPNTSRYCDIDFNLEYKIGGYVHRKYLYTAFNIDKAQAIIMKEAAERKPSKKNVIRLVWSRPELEPAPAIA